MNPLSKFLKGPVIVETTGPDSYDATNGHSITVGKLKVVKDFVAVCTGGYVASEKSKSGNTIVLEYYTGGSEVSNGTDLGSVGVKVIAWGY